MCSDPGSDVEWLTSVSAQLRDRLALVDVPMLSAAESKDLLAGFVDVARLADAGAVLVANTVAEAHPVGVGAATTELARAAGVSRAEAERIVATSKVLPKLDATRAALIGGRLSRTQVGVVAEAAAGAPDFEDALLETARFQDLVGLRRHAERIKASCGDEETRRKNAHATRSWRTWIRDGQWHAHATGTVAEGAEIEQNHRPFRDQALEQARKNGSTEPFGVFGFDGLLTMSRAATGTTGAKPKKRRWQAVIRADASAIRRGHTEPGEVCEIPGVGPIDVAKAIELFGESTVRVLIKDGQDVLSIARVDRYIPPNLQAALLEKAGFQCANRTCSNTGWVEVEHEHDFAKSRDTSYPNNNIFCGTCHDLKTYKGFTITHHPDGTLELTPPQTHDPPGNQPQ